MHKLNMQVCKLRMHAVYTKIFHFYFYLQILVFILSVVLKGSNCDYYTKLNACSLAINNYSQSQLFS